MIKLTTIVLLILSMADCAVAQNKPSIEGKYTVSYASWAIDSRDPLIGSLTLASGTYSFQFAEKHDMTGSSSASYPPFCIEYPQGIYTLQYQNGMSETTHFNDLKDHAIILTITLFANDKEIYRSLIRYNKLKNTFYFHSEKSEIELWEIEKING